MGRFEQKVVLVTGGSTGIGLTTALAFAREGATVVIAGRRTAEGERALALLKKQGAEARFIATDVTSQAEVEYVVKETVAHYRRLDIAFNNAGTIGARGGIAEVSEEEWDATIAINLKGTWLSMKYEIQQMLIQGSGVIVNMGSNIGVHSVQPMVGAYAAAKAGVQTLTKAAALGYIRAGIRINSVSPGPVRTPMSKRRGETDEERNQRVATSLPIGRIGETEEIANAVLWLSSPEASFVVGHDIVLDGGFTLQ